MSDTCKHGLHGCHACESAALRAEVARLQGENAELRAGPGGQYIAAMEQDDPLVWMNEHLQCVTEERDAADTRAAEASDRAADAERAVERSRTALACAVELLDDEPHLRTFDQRRRAVLTDRLRSALAEYDAKGGE